MNMNFRDKWNLRFMELADHISQWSPDRSAKVGAVIVDGINVVSVGYNAFPAGCDDTIEERHQRPEKYFWMIHAEQMAISNAARLGHKTMGCDMYITWFPCSTCAGLIINAGIKRIYCDEEPDWTQTEPWLEDQKIALEKLREVKVEIIYMNYAAHRRQNVPDKGNQSI